MRLLMNPLSLDYKFQHYGDYAHREAADPTLVYFNDRYYLFVSMSGGFYISNDLMHWDLFKDINLPIDRYAPDVRVIGDYLYYSSSTAGQPATFYRSKDPVNEGFEEVSSPFAFWDPNLFWDDDGRVYFYWGCSDKTPIYGVEMDLNSMEPLGDPVPLIWEHDDAHGWERVDYPKLKRSSCQEADLSAVQLDTRGQTGRKPYIEGAFLNKFHGKYYLQYAAPGTEIPVYGDGVYIADHPLGPYTYMKNSPFSFRPQGFMTGAGHGSTIYDAAGNLWHASTMQISVNMMFERRVGLFPAAVDEDGYLFCQQHFADYPYDIPQGRFDPRSLKPKWMLLSYACDAKASSTYRDHLPSLAVDENSKTAWVATGSKDEWLAIDLAQVCDVHLIHLNFFDAEIPLQEDVKQEGEPETRLIDLSDELRTRWILEGSVDGKAWFVLEDKSTVNTNLPHDYVLWEEGIQVRYIRLRSIELPYDARFAISGLRVFGTKEGVTLPDAVTEVQAQRLEDEMTAYLNWEPVENAQGYNVRYGIAPDKLYTSYQVYAENEILITSLNRGVSYWFAVDAFNEAGIQDGVVQKL